MGNERFTPTNLPDLDSLRCFEAAARTRNFRAAAKQVALSPAAFGQRIRGLEEQLGARLFERTSRNVSLTEAGLSLLPKAVACLEAAAACAVAVTAENTARPTRIALGTRFELGMSWILPQLESIERSLPHLALDLYFGSGPDVLAKVGTGELHCAVTSARIPDASYEAETLHEERYVFVGARSLIEAHPLAEPAHARAHTLFDTGPDLPLYRYVRDAPEMRGPMPFADYRYLGLGAAIHALVLAGKGVAVLPRYMVEGDLRSGALVALFPEIEPQIDHFRLVFAAEDPRRALYGALADVLREQPIT